MNFVTRLFGSRTARDDRSARLPDDTRVYAVGDVHGRADLLESLLGKIGSDADAAAENRVIVVFLGDYIDRGPDSRAVIDQLLAVRDGPLEIVTLKGNHEDLMLRFLDDPEIGPLWFDNGGNATLLSYRVSIDRSLPHQERFDDIRRTLCEKLPRAHLDFLRDLSVSFELGDYLFVHAGIRPGVDLQDQKEEDLLWIRDAFLETAEPLEKVVVHGHSIRYQPEIDACRIGVDTGAFATGKLTAAVLYADQVSFLST